VGRHDLTDKQYALIEPLLPKNGRRGKQWKDHRAILNGIVFRVCTGVAWRDVPERYGPWQTLHRRFTRWARDGTLARVMEALQMRLDEEGLIDWDLWSIDGTNIRASRAAAGAGKKGAAENPKTMLLAAPAAGSGPSSMWLLTAGGPSSPPSSRRARRTSPSTSKQS